MGHPETQRCFAALNMTSSLMRIGRRYQLLTKVNRATQQLSIRPPNARFPRGVSGACGPYHVVMCCGT